MFYIQNQEERLFDRGETNTYREDVLFVQLVAEQLEKITQQASLGGDGDHSISKTYRDARLDVTADQKSVDSLIMSSGEEHQSVDKEINLESKEPMSRSSRDASVDRGMELLDGSFVRLSVDPCQGEGQAVARDQESTSDSISQSSADAGHKDKRTDQESMDSSVSIPFGDASHQQYSTEPKPQKRVSEDAADKDDVVKQKSDDVQIEGLVADLLEFFSKKLNDMDVLDPVSPFRDSVLHEACLRTVQIASAVVRCTRHISKTVNLQPLHDHLQQILNSSCCEVYQTHLQNQEPPHSPWPPSADSEQQLLWGVPDTSPKPGTSTLSMTTSSRFWTAAVVRYTRHISKTRNLHTLHDHLQQILNSSCCEVYQTHLQNQEPPHSPWPPPADSEQQLLWGIPDTSPKPGTSTLFIATSSRFWTAAVVRCTRHISITRNLRTLHRHLQQILNSSCCEVYQTHLHNQEPPHSSWPPSADSEQQLVWGVPDTSPKPGTSTLFMTTFSRFWTADVARHVFS